MKKKKTSAKHQAWIDARKRFGLSDAHIQMARELGLNPKKFGSLANHKQEPWKVPLPQFIEDLYLDRFGRTRPEHVKSIEKMVKDQRRKKSEKKEQKRQDRKIETEEVESQQATASDTDSLGALEY